MALRSSHSLRTGIFICVIIMIGCAKDIRPIYSKPTLAANEVALLEGTANLITGMSAYIDDVDGARVDKGLLIAFVAQKVTVVPGEHVIGLEIYQQQGQYASSRKTRFKFSFEAGHTYDFGPNGLFDGRVNMKDMTTGTQIVVE